MHEKGKDYRLETCFARNRRDQVSGHQPAGKALRRVKA